MSHTNSWSFPNMLNVSSNSVNIVEDNISVVNRTRLLILTEPTELYNNPEFGVGLKRHLWQYNTSNQIAIIKDRINAQLRKCEPCVDPDKTSYADGLLFTGSDDMSMNENMNSLKMTIGLSTTYGDDITVTFNQLLDDIETV